MMVKSQQIKVSAQMGCVVLVLVCCVGVSVTAEYADQIYIKYKIMNTIK